MPARRLSLLFVLVQVTSAAFYLACLLILILAAADGFSGSDRALTLFGIYTPYLCLGALVASIAAQIPWRENGKPIWKQELQ